MNIFIINENISPIWFCGDESNVVRLHLQIVPMCSTKQVALLCKEITNIKT